MLQPPVNTVAQTLHAESIPWGATMIVAGPLDQRIVIYPMGRGAEAARVACLLAVESYLEY